MHLIDMDEYVEPGRNIERNADDHWRGALSYPNSLRASAIHAITADCLLRVVVGSFRAHRTSTKHNESGRITENLHGGGR